MANNKSYSNITSYLGGGVQTITSFRGLRQFLSKVNLAPDYAEDILNVIVSKSGGLEKFRLPVAFTAIIGGIGALPIVPFIDYQQSGVRQLVGVIGPNLVFWNTALVPTIIETNVLWSGSVADMIEANNELYIMSPTRGALKWLGAQLKLQSWGIAAPPAPVVLIMGGIIDTIANSGANRTAGLVTVKTTAIHNFDATDVGKSVVIAGVSVGALSFNGTFVITSVNPAGHSLQYAQAGADETQGGGTMALAGGFAITTFRSYGLSYGNSIDGGESSLGPQTQIGPVAVATGYKILSPAPADVQVTHYFVWDSQDGGGDLFLNNDAVAGTPIATNYEDTNDDNHLQNNIVPQRINGLPPVGKYLTKFQDRIFIFNLTGASHDIAYSGYEKIARGVPAQAYPPNNRLRLAIGADDIRGGGVIQAGVVAFSKSNEMFMFRGIVEDVTTTDPVVFSAFLEQLPWSEGLLSHYSCASTPRGLAYVASDRTVKLFDGTNQPTDISGGVYPLMQRITDGREESVRGTYFNWLEREWYVLILPLDGSQTGNWLLFFDLDADDNFGCFPVNLPADDIGVVEDVTGRRHLIISHAGQLYELQVSGKTRGGLFINPSRNADPLAVLSAFWRSGYFGDGTTKQQWRRGQVVTDQDSGAGFGIRSRLVDGDRYDFRNPLEYDPPMYRNGRFSIAMKGTRLQLEVVFPEADMDAAVLQLSIASIPLSDKI